MQNSLQLPYPFSALNLASVFELSSLANQQNSMLHNNNNNNSSTNNNNNVSDSSSRYSMNSSSKSPPDSPHNIDAATAMSRFLFPPAAILAHGFCHIAPGEDSCKEKFLKKSGMAGKSFTIDSLLGLNNAARAVIQSGIVSSPHHHHHHHHAHLGALNEMNLSSSLANNWRPEHSKLETKKENRYHPFNNNNNNNVNTSNNNNNNHHHGQSQSGSRSKQTTSSNSSGGQEKSQEPSQAVRRAAKAKRVRTIFTPEQLERLEAEFERQQYMVGPERLYLASSLHLTEAQVKVWFQNRRIKWRKQHLEMQQQRLAALRSQQHDIDDDGSSDFGGSSSPTPTVVSSSCINEAASLPLPTGAALFRKASMQGHLQSALTPSSGDLCDQNEIRDPSRNNSSSPKNFSALQGHMGGMDSVDFHFNQ